MKKNNEEKTEVGTTSPYPDPLRKEVEDQIFVVEDQFNLKSEELNHLLEVQKETAEKINVTKLELMRLKTTWTTLKGLLKN